MTTRSVLGLSATAILTLLLLAEAGTAQYRQQRPPQQRQITPPAPPGDKRDRTVAAPGTAFHGKVYWRSAAQCGGIYFKLGAMYGERAVNAKVVKPDPTAYDQISKQARATNRTATAFFEAAERFLIADRKISREEAVLAYDPVSSGEGDKLKSVEAAIQASKPCPGLYQACRTAFPQVCNDTSILQN